MPEGWSSRALSIVGMAVARLSRIGRTMSFAERGDMALEKGFVPCQKESRMLIKQ